MTDPGQRALADFDDGAGPARPDAEAAAVAGNGDDSADEVVDPEYETLPDADGSLELQVMQVDYTITGRGDDERPILHVFGRTATKRAEHVRVHGFRPYFYAPVENVDEERIAGYDGLTGFETTDGNDDPYESIRGERLAKVFGRTPRDVGQVRDDFEHYEADILFPNRLLIDKAITAGVRVPERRETEDAPVDVHHEELEPTEVDADPRVLTLDIEVDDRRGFPEDGEEPIICLATHDSYDDEYVGWIFDPDGGDGDLPTALPDFQLLQEDDEHDIEGAGDTGVEIRTYDTEEAMLDAFLAYVERRDPDVLTGWNFDDFDAPYLLDRLEELQAHGHGYDLSIERLSRVDEVWRSGWGGPDIKGRVVFDLLYAYERTKFSELDSYRLDDVGEVELGVGKERYPGDIGDLWENDPERLLEYNVRDVELCVELDRKQDIVAFWDEVRTFVGCKLEDATTPGDAVDMYVLQEIHGEFALPSKGQHEGEEYEGGAVFDPITGVRDMVSVLDLKCFSGDTDIATPDGLRNIRDLDVGDPVYTLDPETFECEIQPVVETHSYDNEYGELHHVSGNTHDFKVTENHRFLLSKTRGWDDLTPSDYEFVEYRDVPDWERFAFPNHEPMAGVEREQFDLLEAVDDGHVAVYADEDLTGFRAAMPAGVESSLDWANGTSRMATTQEKTGTYLLPIETYRIHRETIDEHADDVFLKYDRRHDETPTAFEMDDWLELIGWFATEGSFIRESPGIVLHQQNEDGRSSIRRLLERMDLNYSVDGDGFYVSNRFLHDWFIDNCGDGYANKHLPEWVFELDASHLRVLLETLVDGDGSRTESGLRKFWTKSDQLKEDIVRLAVRCGEKPTVSKGPDGTWYVSIGKRGSMKRANATVEDHDGQVHCITARDNHVVLAGRNGTLQWVGQSLYPMCMVTINASPETKVDPDSYDADTYAAPNGTHFRKEPDGVIREMVDELLSEREQKKELRNEHEPGSSEYERFDRQQGAVKVIMNCFTPDTDVLTPDGVRNIRDLEVGDRVYSIDPDTMEMEIKPVVETQEYPDYRGDLVDIQTSKVDFSVTPNHRMLVRKNDKNGITEDGWDFVEAGDLYDYCHYELPHDWDFEHGDELDTVDLTQWYEDDYEVWVRPSVHGSTFTTELGWTPPLVLNNDLGVQGYVLSSEEFERHRTYIESVCEHSFVHTEANGKWIPRMIEGDDFLELLAWYTTEGNVYTSEPKQFGDNYRGSSTTVQIAQNKSLRADGGDDHATIGDLLDAIGLDYYVDERSYQFTSRLLGNLLEELCGSGSENKQIPEFVFDLSKQQKRRYLETLVDGDGDRQPNSWRFTTSSSDLRDDVLRLCTHLGLTANYGRNSGSWRVYVAEGAKNSFRMHRSGSRSTAEDGVYCVTVADNHTLLAGRNGTFQFVGQSLYGVLGWDRFRLYDKEMGAAVTATGRDVIEFTEEAANELNKEVTYGDTDSVMLELGHDVSVEEAIEQSFEIEEHINDAYDEYALERLNAETHRFQIEFEKLYKRFFQAGKKKRYAGHIVWKEGKEVDDIDITGFEYQRSDIAEITKEVQHEVIDMIVRGEDIEDVEAYVHDVIHEFLEGEYDPERVAIPGGIGKRLDNYDTDTAQVRGAKYANEFLGTNFGRGSKPKRLYLESVHPSFFRRLEEEDGYDAQQNDLYREFKQNPDVICIEYADQLPEEFAIDWEKMLDKTLKGPIARILEALDVSWEEVKTGQEQTGLGQFV